MGSLGVMGSVSSKGMLGILWSALVNGQGQEASNSRDPWHLPPLGQGHDELELQDCEAQWQEAR